MFCEQPQYSSFTDKFHPCRRCWKCQKVKQSHWAYRLAQETYQAHKWKTWFCTLTFRSTLKPDTFSPSLTSFMKYLRTTLSRNFPENRLRYFAVLEHGSKTGRPHYHCLIWSSTPHLTKRLIHKAWPHGFSQGKLDRDWETP